MKEWKPTRTKKHQKDCRKGSKHDKYCRKVCSVCLARIDGKIVEQHDFDDDQALFLDQLSIQLNGVTSDTQSSVALATETVVSSDILTVSFAESSAQSTADASSATLTDSSASTLSSE